MWIYLDILSHEHASDIENTHILTMFILSLTIFFNNVYIVVQFFRMGMRYVYNLQHEENVSSYKAMALLGSMSVFIIISDIDTHIVWPFYFLNYYKWGIDKNVCNALNNLRMFFTGFCAT